MKSLRLTNGEAVFEVDPSFEEDALLPSHGDARLVLRVRSHGYAAESFAWIGRDELAAFLRDVKTLDERSSGGVTLESLSPNELRLSLVAIDGLGHFAAEGTFGRRIHDVNAEFWHSISFGFELDRGQIQEVLAWASSNAA